MKIRDQGFRELEPEQDSHIDRWNCNHYIYPHLRVLVILWLTFVLFTLLNL